MKSFKALKTKICGIVSLAFLLMLVLPVEASDKGDAIKINPEFKINRVSNGSVIVTSKNPEETSVKHEFTDFYADLLMGAYRNQSMNIITDNLRKKYYLSEDECRRELKHAINILTEWKILLREDDLALQQK